MPSSVCSDVDDTTPLADTTTLLEKSDESDTERTAANAADSIDIDSPVQQLPQSQHLSNKVWSIDRVISLAREWKWPIWYSFLFLSLQAVSLVGFTMRIKPSNPDDPKVKYVGKFYQLDKAYLGLLMHIVGSFVVGLVGPFQLVPYLRKKYMKLHRVLGWMYAIFMVISIIGSFWLIPYIVTGVLVNKFGLGFLTLGWLFTISQAIYHIKFSSSPQRFQLHREWMIRNMGLTMASVTLRLWLGILVSSMMLFGYDVDTAFVEAYRTVGFLCWVPNAVIVEVYINYTKPTPAARAVATNKEFVANEPGAVEAPPQLK